MTPPVPGRAAATALGDRRAVPSVEWLTALTGLPSKRIGEFLAETDALVELEREVRSIHRDAGRSFYAQFRAPLELYALVRALRPDHIVETGVSSGVSSMHFLLGLAKNGQGALHSVDRPLEQVGPTLGPNESPVAVPPGRSSGWAIPTTVRHDWDLRLGTAEDELPPLVRSLPTIDLFLHDSHHTPEHLTFELETVRPKLSPGAIVLADNTVWTGESFPRFAAQFGATVVRRRRSDLVGFRMPAPSGPRSGRPAIRRSPPRSQSSR